jgi:hypothetical protein
MDTIEYNHRIVPGENFYVGDRVAFNEKGELCRAVPGQKSFNLPPNAVFDWSNGTVSWDYPYTGEAKMTPKMQNNLREMVDQITRAYECDPAGTGALVNATTLNAKRMVKRATVPDGMERIEYAPSKGPTVEFTGQLLHSADLNGNAIEITQSLSGKLVVFQEWQGDWGDTLSRVDVCEPGDHLAVMDALNWSSLARSAARKLGWNLRIEVE